jgi:hypothetical protein
MWYLDAYHIQISHSYEKADALYSNNACRQLNGIGKYLCSQYFLVYNQSRQD